MLLKLTLTQHLTHDSKQPKINDMHSAIRVIVTFDRDFFHNTVFWLVVIATERKDVP